MQYATRNQPSKPVPHEIHERAGGIMSPIQDVIVNIQGEKNDETLSPPRIDSDGISRGTAGSWYEQVFVSSLIFSDYPLPNIGTVHSRDQEDYREYLFLESG